MLAPGPHTFTEHLQDPKAEHSPQKLVLFFGGGSKQTNTTLEEGSVARLYNLAFGNLIQYFSL